MAAGRSGSYTEKSDIWSLAVVVWILLAGDYPFLRTQEDLEDKAKVDKLVKASYKFGITWRGRSISQEGKDFVARCLKRRPEDRWTSTEALKYLQETWVPALEERDGEGKAGGTDEAKVSPTAVEHKLNSFMSGMESVGISMEDVNRFCSYGRMKKTVLMTMANTMEREDVEGLRNIFLSADMGNTGTVSLLELKAAFQKLHPEMGDVEFEVIFRGMDHDRSGQIHWAEFVAALSESYGLVTRDRLAEAFDRIDQEGKGYIAHDDLKSLLGKDYDTKTVDSMIKEADFKGNGQVDYEELLQLMLEDPANRINVTGDAAEPPRTAAGMGDIGSRQSQLEGMAGS